MKRTKDFNTNKGITLIALIITIIVMLILVGVTISMAVNGGLFNYAGRATGETKNAINAEQDLASGGITIGGTYYNSIDEYLNKDKVETISKETSYVGYYADVDGDKVVDGVIYADLAIGGEGGYDWLDYSYSYAKETGLKDYYVSGTYEGYYGTKEVLTATGEGKDRFYVMDFSRKENYYSWYASKLPDGPDDDDALETVTETGFGTGKANTDKMIAIWNADTNEAKNDNDVWGNIQNLVSEGWFLPSRDEMYAFALLTVPEADERIDDWTIFWTSSQSDSGVWAGVLDSASIDYYGDINTEYEILLSTIF